jgi:hypothetical protein
MQGLNWKIYKKTVAYDKKKKGRKTKLNSKSTKIKKLFIYNNTIIPEIMIKEALMSENDNKKKPLKRASSTPYSCKYTFLNISCFLSKEVKLRFHYVK